jgi:hypothetical protein
MPLTEKLKAFIKDRHWLEADKVADELLALMKGDSQIEAKTKALPLMDRLPLKIQKIQKELPAWSQKTGNTEKATALMQKLDEHLKAKKFEEAEKTADSILKMIGVSGQAADQGIPEEARKKLRHELGGSFLVSRDKVQEELGLTKEQQEKLEQRLRELIPDAMQFFQQIDGLKREEREKELRAYGPRAQEKLAAVLKSALEGPPSRPQNTYLRYVGMSAADRHLGACAGTPRPEGSIKREGTRLAGASVERNLADEDTAPDDARGADRFICPEVFGIRRDRAGPPVVLNKDPVTTQPVFGAAPEVEASCIVIVTGHRRLAPRGIGEVGASVPAIREQEGPRLLK